MKHQQYYTIFWYSLATPQNFANLLALHTFRRKVQKSSCTAVGFLEWKAKIYRMPKAKFIIIAEC